MGDMNLSNKSKSCPFLMRHLTSAPFLRLCVQNNLNSGSVITHVVTLAEPLAISERWWMVMPNANPNTSFAKCQTAEEVGQVWVCSCFAWRPWLWNSVLLYPFLHLRHTWRFDLTFKTFIKITMQPRNCWHETSILWARGSPQLLAALNTNFPLAVYHSLPQTGCLADQPHRLDRDEWSQKWKLRDSFNIPS